MLATPNSGVPARRVSVVIPVHNGSSLVAETLRSVAAQTHRADEIIVVDDGSIDSTCGVALDCGVALQLIRQANSGVSAARNSGLAAASGDLICFLDQDDCWYPNHLERQVSYLAAHPEVGVVVSPYQHWYPGDAGYPPADRVLPSQPSGETDPSFTGWVYHQFMLDCWALTSATMIRREVLAEHGAFDPSIPFSEDWDLWLRLSREVRFAKLNWPPVLYRQHPTQGSRMARPVDYRSELLLAAAAVHGLVSKDGRRVPPAVFKRTVARYQASFGYHQLQYGDFRLATRSLLSAWRRDPRTWRPLAMAAAAWLGWRPAFAEPRLTDGRDHAANA